MIQRKEKMEELSKILQHAVPSVWAKQSQLQVWDFQLKTDRETCAMFEHMEVSEQIYETGTPSKTPTMLKANCDGNVRGKKEGEATSSTNPEKGHSGNRKTKNAGHLSDAPTGAKKHACCMSPDTPHSSITY